MEFDEEILKDFLIEVKEGIERLEDGFIRLERGEREVLKELFRVMHSLKGAAGFFGFKALEQVAHASEDILARLRDGLIEPTDEIIDMLLKAVDYIKRIVKHIEDKRKEPIDDELLDFLIELTTFSDKIAKKEETKRETKKEELLEEIEKKGKIEEKEKEIEREIEKELKVEEEKKSFEEEKIVPKVDEEILKDFLIEVKEGIERLEDGFIRLERGEREVLKELFRVMHSLKGAAGFFGFKALEQVAHASEDILARLRDGLIEPTDEIIDMLLKAVDYIKRIVKHIEDKKKEPIDDGLLDFLIELTTFSDKIAKKEETKRETKKEELLEEIEKKEKIEERKKDTILSQVSLKETYVKIDTKLLDLLMNLASELVLARNRILQISQKIKNPELQTSVQILSTITTELQETIMKTRMQPIGIVFNKFPRIVRDLSKALNKKVKLHIEGAETELDRSMIEAIKDPLTHLIRNAIDHGIEFPEEREKFGKSPEGNLSLRAYQESGYVIIEVEDDGKGIDIEKIKKKAIEKGFLSLKEAESISERELMSFIFKPGFSTAEKITELSGRGVGMDVVKSNIEKLGGTIELNTVPGKGTTVRLKIPLTLAIIPALIVTCKGFRYAIPQVNIKKLIKINLLKDIICIGEGEFYRLKEEIIPVLKLSKILQIENGEQEIYKNLIILTLGEERYLGIIVDEILTFEEIVVKPLGKQIKNIPIYSGATIMGDGKLALILDIVGLSKYAGFKKEEIEKKLEEDIKWMYKEEKNPVLLFGIGKDVLAIPLALISRLDKIKAEDIQIAGKKEIIVYRNQVIPIIRLENYLPLQKLPSQKSYYVLIFTENGKTCGVLCSEILNILEISLEIEEGLYNTPGILGHKIINEKTVLFIDIYKIIHMYDPKWFSIKKENIGKRILLIEDLSYFRNMIKNYLKDVGYEVESVEEGKKALEKLKQDSNFDLIVTDLSLPLINGYHFIEILKRDPIYSKIPIIALTSLSKEKIEKKVLELGAEGCENKFNREQIINTIEKFFKKL